MRAQQRNYSFVLSKWRQALRIPLYMYGLLFANSKYQALYRESEQFMDTKSELQQ